MKYLLLLFCLQAFAQSNIIYNGEQINALDAANNKTGLWKAFDDEKDLLITCEYKDGLPISETKYYKDSRLIATYDNVEIFTIIRTTNIKAKLLTKEDKTTVLTDLDGKELDKKIQDFFKENCQISPKYYGGEKSFLSYINTNIDKAKAHNKSGKMIVKFWIDSNGYYEAAEIKESINPAMDAEAIKVLKNMARWQPGHRHGKFATATYNIPIAVKVTYN